VTTYSLPSPLDPTTNNVWGADLNNWAKQGQMVVLGVPGVLATQTGVSRLLMPYAGTIVGAVAAVNTAPTGATLICDVKKNGTTIYTTSANRPTIAISANATTTMPTPDVTTFAALDYLTVDIDQVGSTIAGSDLTVSILYFWGS
jgi:hypothetical protein